MRKSFLFIIPLIFAVLLVTSNQTMPVNAKGESQVTIEKPVVEKEESNQSEINHKEIVDLTTQFMNLLVQDVDENYQVKRYDTKEELMNAFDKVATSNVARPFVDYYYNEKRDGLYILPTETPGWFVEHNAYDIIRMEDHKVKVVQPNEDALHGDYQIEIEFTFNKEWKITDIKHS